MKLKSVGIFKAFLSLSQSILISLSLQLSPCAPFKFSFPLPLLLQAALSPATCPAMIGYLHWQVLHVPLHA